MSSLIAGIHKYRRDIFNRLDRPGGRILLAALGSIYNTFEDHWPCTVRYKDGVWIHHHADGYLVERQIMLNSLHHFAALIDDTFCYTYRPKSGDVVIDCGAYTGWETLVFSRMVGEQGYIFALEPHPIAYRCLSETCRLNKLRNVTALESAAGANQRTAILTDLHDLPQANTIMTGAKHGYSVPVITLDKMLAEFDRAVNFLKINVEGAELEVLQGAQETLKRTQHVACSCDDFMADQGWGEVLRTKSKVREILRSAGFRISERANDPRPWIADYIYADSQPPD